MANITGTPSNDILIGTLEADNIRGLEGNDVISGLDGADQIDGGAGNDSIVGNQGNDSIFGNAGDDSAFGGQGNDLVVGEAGNDILAGDAGTNTLTGGIGRDAFILSTSGTSTITDFFTGDDSLGLTGDLTIEDIEVAQNFANTAVIDRRTGNVLATLNNVSSNNLRVTNFVDANGRPVNFAPGVATLVDVTATDPIAQATNANDPIVFTVSRTNTTGELTVNFTLTTTSGVALQNPPTSVRIPAGQTSANVIVTPQATSRDGNVTITLQENASYDVRTGVANGTVSAPIVPAEPAPAPEPPDAPTVVDLVLTRVDIPATPSAGERVTSTFTVFNRGTAKADRVEFNTNLPVETEFVSAVPSQGSFTNFSGDTTRGGIINVELGSIEPNRSATIVVTYEPQTTGNVVLTNANVTSAQVDVDPSNNFANAGFTIIPSPPDLPVISVIASNDGSPAQEPDTTQLEDTDRETEDSSGDPAGLITQDFIITRTGGDLTRPLTVNYTLDGTAENTTDFSPIGGSVVFAPFQTEARVTIRPIQDRQVEGDEFVRLTLTPNPLVFAVDEEAETNTARINILDVANPAGPAPLPGTVVSLVAIDQFADEFRPDSASGGSTPGAVSPVRGVLRVTRDNTIGNLTVNVEISGTANSPDDDSEDYVLFVGTDSKPVTVTEGVAVITIPDGQSFVDVILQAEDDSLSEGDEDAIFNVAPGESYVIGRPQDVAADNPAVVRIRDNETPPTVSISVVDGSEIGDEADGTPIVFRVTRNGDLAAPRTVVIELPRDFTLGADPDDAGPLTAPIVFDSDTAGRPRQIQRNGPFDKDGEDYSVTGPTVFLGDSNLTSFFRTANLSQFEPDTTSNRFLVTIPAGASTADIIVTPINDRVTETVESVVARIVPPPQPEQGFGDNLAPSDIPPGGFIVTGGAAEGFILDSDVTQTLRLTATDTTATEGQTTSPGNATLTITRTGDTNRPIDVPLTVISATSVSDSTSVAGLGGTQQVERTFDPNELPAFVTIPAGEGFVEIVQEETVTITLGAGGSTEVTLRPRLIVARTGSRALPLEIPQAIIRDIIGAESATLGSDFNLPSSVLIESGATTASVSIDALSDGIPEETERFAVIVGGNVDGFQVIGQPAAFTIVNTEDILINDLIQGTAQSDNLNGGAGNDTLIGGPGIDTLVGGTEADLFVFNEAGVVNADALIDFSIGQGDQIRLLRSAGGGAIFPGNIGRLSDLALNNAINVFGNAFAPFSPFLEEGDNDLFGAPDIPTYSYDSLSGRFLVDADGTSGGSQYVAIATLPINLTPNGTVAEVQALFNQISISL